MRRINFALTNKKFARYNYVKFNSPNEIAPLVASSAARPQAHQILAARLAHDLNNGAANRVQSRDYTMRVVCGRSSNTDGHFTHC